MIEQKPVAPKMVASKRLKPAEWNPRLITDARFQALCRSIQADPNFMALRPVLAQSDGTIYAGNMRYRACVELGWRTVPAILQDVPDDVARERMLRDNNQWGDWQEDELAALLYGLQEHDVDLSTLGFDSDQLTSLLNSVGGMGDTPVPEDPGAQIDRADELREKWQTERGQLWVIGRHRLLCGDSTSAEDVARLMGGEKADMVFADPPYGISIVATNVSVGGGEAYDIPFGGKKGHVGGGAAYMARTGMTYMEAAKKGLGSANGAKPFGSKAVRGTVGSANVVDVGKYLPVKGDDTTDTAVTAYRLMADLYPSAVHVWWGGNYYANALPPSPCWIVWDKDNTGNFADCELAWTNQDKAARIFEHRWNGMLKASEQGQRRVHPTQKPVALAEWCFQNYGKPGDVVLDPFVGSGMSMVAAERTDRAVYAIEYEDAYIAVILERLSQMGLVPRLAE